MGLVYPALGPPRERLQKTGSVVPAAVSYAKAISTPYDTITVWMVYRIGFTDYLYLPKVKTVGVIGVSATLYDF